MKPKKHVKRQMKRIEEMEAEVHDAELMDELPTVKTVPMLGIAINEVLKGTNQEQLQAVLESKGYPMGKHKVYDLIRAAKKEILRRGERDFEENYAWVQENLMAMHAEAIDSDDPRMRLVVIKELADLWGLKKQQVEKKDTVITAEMLEQFERQLLR